MLCAFSYHAVRQQIPARVWCLAPSAVTDEQEDEMGVEDYDFLSNTSWLEEVVLPKAVLLDGCYGANS